MSMGNQNIMKQNNSLIKEEKEEDSSGTGEDSDNGLRNLTSGNTHSTFTKDKGRFSQEVKQAKIAHLNNTNSVDDSGTKLIYRNSEDSSKGYLSTPPLTQNPNVATNQKSKHRNSSQNENDDKEEETDGFISQIPTHNDRENRQTFASHTAESLREEPQLVSQSSAPLNSR